MPDFTQPIKQAAQDVGFDVVGIACINQAKPLETCQTGNSVSSPATGASTLFARLTTWLEAGYHGTMTWMAHSPERRASPEQVLPGCRSMVCVGVNYYTRHVANEQPGMGRIARYAWGKDYHRIIDKRLQQLEQDIHSLSPEVRTRRYVDTGPVMEKAWAQQAGIGWIGKHSNLVSPRFGSWLLLGEILTTLDLEADEPGTDLCGTCSLCIKACPTGAITDPYIVDATKCLSYVTIEFSGPQDGIDKKLQRQMGNRIFGCDDCLDICPYNNMATPSKESAFEPTVHTQAPELARLLEINEEDFKRTFQGSPIRRAKHAGFRRNVQIALSNLSKPSVDPTASPPS